VTPGGLRHKSRAEISGSSTQKSAAINERAREERGHADTSVDTFDRGGDQEPSARPVFVWGSRQREKAARSGSVGHSATSYLVDGCQCTPTAARPQRSGPVTIPASSCWPLPGRPSPASKRRGLWLLRCLVQVSCACISPFYPRGVLGGGNGPAHLFPPWNLCCGVPVCVVRCGARTLRPSKCNRPAPHSMSSCTWRASSEARMPDALHSRCELALPSLSGGRHWMDWMD
jgi:hypothetical protein